MMDRRERERLTVATRTGGFQMLTRVGRAPQTILGPVAREGSLR